MAAQARPFVENDCTLSFELEDSEDVLNDVDGNIYGPVTRFFSKHFPSIASSQGAEDDFANQSVRPAFPAPENFVNWFISFFSQDLDRPGSEWQVSYREIFGAKITAGAHLFLSHSNDTSSNTASAWANVQVIGEFSQDDTVSYRDGLLTLCALARQTFASQPDRLFLHGFYIRRTLMELWIFDRSGIYSSEVFDIQAQFSRFLGIIRTYRSMSYEQLGKGSILKSSKTGNYVTLEGFNGSQPKMLYLAEEPIASRPDLVGGGTTCYLARASNSDQWDFAVKFKWRLTRNRPEDVMLNLINSQNVPNITSLVYYSETNKISDLRAGLQFGLLRRFTDDEAGFHDNEAAGVSRHTEETRDRFSNKTFTCVVTAPVGRPLRTFKTPLELIRVLRDAINAHRSMHQNAGILHQDISEENILISSEHVSSGSKGVLIDYDVATLLSDQDETATSITGTRPFMAIGVLRGEMHTYRHDLESFLYVLLWAIISNHSKNPPDPSKLKQWSRGSYDEIASRKTRDMSQTEFHNVLSEFSPGFDALKQLAEKLRGILFPLRDGIQYTGTDKQPTAINELYQRFLDAFDSAIVELNK